MIQNSSNEKQNFKNLKNRGLRPHLWTFEKVQSKLLSKPNSNFVWIWFCVNKIKIQFHIDKLNVYNLKYDMHIAYRILLKV